MYKRQLYLLLNRLTGGLMLRCPMKWLTGWSCPGCGSQRALMALTRGDIAEALTVNLLLLPTILYLILLWVCYIWSDTPRGERLHRRITSPGVLAAIALLVILWAIVRNIAGI